MSGTADIVHDALSEISRREREAYVPYADDEEPSDSKISK